MGTKMCSLFPPQGVIVSCDPWFACLFGYANGIEVVGKSAQDLIPSLTLPSAKQGLLKVVCLVPLLFVIDRTLE